MSYVETPTGRIHYRVDDLTAPWANTGQTIVFHHGIGADVNIWGNWLPVLAPYYRLVRFDMRGFGDSVVPPEDFAWSFDVLVADALAVADAVGIGKFHLAGESIGGTAAIAFALRHPQRVMSMTLSNAAARGGLVSNVSNWRDLVAQSGQAGWAQFMMQSRFHPGALPAEQFDWFMNVHQKCSMSACFKLADQLLASDLTEQLERIQAPTLLLAPDASPFIPLEVMVDMRRRLPQAELQVFAHAKHGLPLSHGEACAKVLRAFLSQHFP
jgi:pimeloyl-ACP methyl ester carboxylesterase